MVVVIYNKNLILHALCCSVSNISLEYHNHKNAKIKGQEIRLRPQIDDKNVILEIGLINI